MISENNRVSTKLKKNLKYRYIKTEVRLRMAIQLVQSLEFSSRLQLSNKNGEINNPSYQGGIETSEDAQEKKYLKSSPQENLRKELLERLQNLRQAQPVDITQKESLLESPIVKRLRRLLAQNKGIREEDSKGWEDIEVAVHKSFPEFKDRLMILTLGNMSEKEYRVALLTRCGFRPKEISILLLRGKSTATDRRRSLAKKIFGNSADNSALDALIQRI